MVILIFLVKIQGILKGEKEVIMKKLIVLAMLVAIATTGVSARSSRAARNGRTSNGGRSIHALGFAVPLRWQSWEGLADYDEMDLSAVGFNLMYHHLNIRPSRFSTFLDLQMGYINFSIDEINGQKENDAGTSWKDLYGNLNGFNTHYAFGLGGAPIVADRLTLAIHGTFGIHLAIASGSTSGWYSESISNAEMNSTAFGFWTTLGANIDASWRITNHVGVFAGIDMHTNLVGIGTFGADLGPYSHFEVYRINPGDFNVDFRVGVAFTY